MSQMPPEMTVASTQISTRYEILDTPDLTPLGHIIRLLRHPESVAAVLVLRNPQTEEVSSVSVVAINDEPTHERERGAIFFGGTLDDGRHIEAYIFAKPEGEDHEVLGTARIYS